MEDCLYSAVAFQQYITSYGFSHLVYAYPYAIKAKSLHSAILYSYLVALQQPQNQQAKAILLNISKKIITDTPKFLEDLASTIRTSSAWEIAICSPSMSSAEALSQSFKDRTVDSISKVLSVGIEQYKLLAESDIKPDYYFGSTCIVSPSLPIVEVINKTSEYYCLFAEGKAICKDMGDNKLLNMFIPQNNKEYHIELADNDDDTKEPEDLQNSLKQAKEALNKVENTIEKAIKSQRDSLNLFPILEKEIGLEPHNNSILCTRCKANHVEMLYEHKDIKITDIICKQCACNIDTQEDYEKYKKLIAMFNLLRKDDVTITKPKFAT